MLDKPLVSIGMPIYNAEKYLSQALDSLLAQDYPNFELIVSDNASTDATSKICKNYAAKDLRINYSRNSENLGPTENFKRVRDLAQGKYFMWAAHDDLWDPRYLSSCVEILEKHEAVTLCATHAYLIDENSNIIQEYFDRVDTFNIEDRMKRSRIVILGIILNTTFYGVYRLNKSINVPLFTQFGSDHMFMARLSLYGQFFILPQVYFYSRIGGLSSSLYKTITQILNKPSYILYLFPNIYFFGVFARDVLHWTELSWQERIRVLLIVCERYTIGYYGKLIRYDIKRILKHLFLDNPGNLLAKMKLLKTINKNTKRE